MNSRWWSTTEFRFILTVCLRWHIYCLRWFLKGTSINFKYIALVSCWGIMIIESLSASWQCSSVLASWRAGRGWIPCRWHRAPSWCWGFHLSAIQTGIVRNWSHLLWGSCHSIECSNILVKWIGKHIDWFAHFVWPMDTSWVRLLEH